MVGLDRDDGARWREPVETPAPPPEPVLRRRVHEALFGEATLPLRLGRYVALEEIGRGGMGRVLRAYDDKLQRELALKVVRPDRCGGDAQRLVREARALARLADPRVVAVYDVDEVDGQVFVAMELVRGQSLRQWLHREPGSQDEVLRIFCEAGRGLAAAHDAGLVHRDFKPSNVLLGPGPRVRVTDFGLARQGGAQHGDSAPETHASERNPGEERVTTEGSVYGTPCYMAPEQHDARDPDPRADQFAFCVALFEALAGHRPFEGTSLADLARVKRAGIEAWPESIRGPLRQIVARGLSVEPARRFESVRTLVEQLERVQRRRPAGRRAVVAAMGTVLLVGGVAFYADEVAQRRCRTRAAVIERAWNLERRATLAKSYERAAGTFGEQSFANVADRVDDWVAQWRDASLDACQEGLVAPDTAPNPASSVATCLDDARLELEAFLAVCESPNRTIVRRSVEVLDGLASPRSCLDDRSTTMRAPAPPDSVDWSAVRGARAEHHRVRALIATRSDEALPASLDAVERADALGWRPLVLEATVLVGRAQIADGDPGPARETLEPLLGEALGSGHRLAAVDTLDALGEAVVRGSDNYELAEQYATIALALASKRDGSRRAKLGNLIGIARRHQGDLVGAREVLEHNLGSVRDGDSLGAGRLHYTLARVLLTMGDVDGARVHGQEALRIQASVHGSSHPDHAIAQSVLAAVERRVGNGAKALSLAQQALDVVRRHGDGGMELAHAEFATASGLAAVGRFDEATSAATEAIQLATRELGGDHPQIARFHDAVGVMYARAGDLQPARDHARRAISIIERRQGPRSPSLAKPLVELGHMHFRADDFEAAHAAYERAQSLLDPGDPSAQFERARAQLGRADALLELGDSKAAERLYSEALVELERIGDSLRIASGRLGRAKAQWANGDRSSARASMRELLQMPDEAPGVATRKAQAQQWLEQVDPPG